MESNDPQGQPVPAQQQDESAGQPPTPAPPTPAHEETERVTPDAQDEVEQAPDADEPGDDQLPADLEEHVTTDAAPQDEVNQPG